MVTDNGQLLVRQLLGQGGTADVFLCYDHGLGADVAVKILHRELSARPRTLSCLQQEAQVLGRMRHPGILRLYRTFWHADRFAMVLELLGSDLASGLPPDGYQATRALRWTVQLLDALDALHARGMVHRDLKLENVLLDAHDNVRLADLGIRFDMRDEDDVGNLRGSTGSPRTMSPEQLLGHLVDQRSDLYAAGLVLCELATGRLPFDDGALPRSAARYFPDLAPVRRKLGPQVGQVVAKALAVEPDERFSRALAMRTALAAAMGEASVGERLRLGRDPLQADLLFDEEGVSGVHCELYVDGDTVVVTDLDSTNGTFVDGYPLRPYEPTRVSLQAQLGLGRFVRRSIRSLVTGR